MQEIIEKLTDARFIVSLLTAIAVIATIITLAMITTFFDADDDVVVAPSSRVGIGWDRFAVLVIIALVVGAFRAAAWLI